MSRPLKLVLPASAALLAALCPAAQAADAPQLSTITVTAPAAEDGRPRPKGVAQQPATLDHGATQSVTVIDSQEIGILNTPSTLDLLARVPNATVNRNGGIAGTVFLRGLNSNDMRIPMFIDGDRFRGRNTLQFMLISPSEIEQVEVIRGPSSSRYGSDGLAGLINFVTKRAHGNLDQAFSLNGGEASTTYQSNGHGVQGTVALEGAGDGFDLRVYATGRRASDYDSAAGTVPNSDYRSGNAGVVLGYMPDARQRFEASARVAYVKDGVAGAMPAPPLSISRREPLKVKQGRLAYAGEFDGTVKALKASLYVNEFDTLITNHNETNPARVIDTRNNVIGPMAYGGSVSATIPWATAQTIVGMDFMHERRPGSETQRSTQVRAGNGNITTTASGYDKTGPDQYQSNIGAFLTTEWQPAPKWTVSAGGRFDWFRSDVKTSPLPSPNLLPAFQAAQDTTQTATTGSLGLSYRATDVIELLGSVGSSFRMPWTSEMFSAGYTGTSYTIPNPGLKPERGVTVEAGTRLHFTDARIGLTAFRSDYRDFLENTVTTYQGLPATQRRNVGRARIQGVETDWRWQFTRQANVYGNASYLHATNRSTGRPLPSIATLSGLLGLQYVGPNDAYALSGEVQWAKGQSRYAEASEYPAAGYATVNLYAQLQLDRLGLPQAGNTQLVFGVNNLFDRGYRTAATSSVRSYAMSDLNPLLEPGRSVSVTVRTRF
ncbi:Outer membrane vitamin B12 receptor BtuB [plant metagenome]|uniref:Outer membrane vitamin B12 receptor BtuB n=1 Tax=plant metagenome TaxID=1297885 RepID=A0A484QVZ1_9ZZZZ